jgi:cytoskeletal protein RodZ
MKVRPSSGQARRHPARRSQALGLTLEQARKHTRIREKLLEALEEGQLRPPAQSRLRQGLHLELRTLYLELDPVPLLNMYKAETGIGRSHELNLIPQASEAVAPTGQQHAVPWRAAVTIAVVVGVASLGLWPSPRSARAADHPSRTTPGG